MKTMLLILITSLTISVSAQSPIIVDGLESELPIKEQEALWLKRRQYKLNKMGVSVQIPSKYTEMSSFYLSPPVHSSSSSYTFISNDSTVLIVIALLGRDSLDYEREVASAKRSPGFYAAWAKGAPGANGTYDPDVQWYINFKARTDSTSFKPIFYSGTQLRAYNAERAVEFKKSYKELYLNKYQIARNITLNKKYIGIIEIQYFIKPDAKVDIAEEIKNGPNMISYAN